MREKGARPDWDAAEIARRQHGVVADWQLAAAGMTTSAISRRVASGRLHRVHRGVYAVGYRGHSMLTTAMSAVLACGRGCRADPAGDREEREAASPAMPILEYWGAALSHRSAASLWELLPWAEDSIDVSSAGYGGRKKRNGIRLHRSASLLSAAVTLRNGIPVTTPLRTIEDLRRSISTQRRQGLITFRELRRAIRQANVLGLPIGEETDRDRTRSELEWDFLHLCRSQGLPPPEINVHIGPCLVDFLWRARKLVVETDGYRYHRGRAAFENDRGRDLQLRALGYEVIRLSHRQVAEEPEHVAAVLRAALGQDTHLPAGPRAVP